MELIIEIDKIKDTSKREWLLHTLKIMGIRFHTSERAQTLEEYNKDLAEGDAEIDRGEYVTAEALKAEITTW